MEKPKGLFGFRKPNWENLKKVMEGESRGCEGKCSHNVALNFGGRGAIGVLYKPCRKNCYIS